jgi:hypothetical protein
MTRARLERAMNWTLGAISMTFARCSSVNETGQLNVGVDLIEHSFLRFAFFAIHGVNARV